MTHAMKSILVPTDFSPYSCEAFSWAALLAEKFEAKILILHVVPESEAHEMVSAPGNPWEKVLEVQDKAMIENFSTCMLSDFSMQTQKETIVAVGRSAEEIIGVAKEHDVDLIVMSTHGRTGLLHALMGSVAEKVVRQAPCPVLTMKPQEVGGKDRRER